MRVHPPTVDPSRLRPKAAGLVRLRRAGLPVPDAVVLDLPPLGDALGPVPEPALALLADGPVIVRSAFASEDGTSSSAAGLGRSIPDVRDADALADAITTIADARGDAFAPAPAADPRATPDQIVVQRFVAARWIVVAADHAGHVDVQVHPPSDDALGSGATPAWVGSAARWPDPAAAAVRHVVEAARAALPPAEHGHDLELVVDTGGEVHVVQARPIVAALHPDADALLRLGRQADPSLDLSGHWTLDAEHNPAPLSPAHAWLLGWLRARRPAAGRPTSVAGWLYVQTLPRDLVREAVARARPVPEVLAALLDTHLPQARRRLAAVEARLDEGRDDAALESALAAFLAMIDAYLGVLVPVRAAARASGLGPGGDLDAPLSLRDRDAFADVLPATWDVASPSLADLGLGEATPRRTRPQIPDEPAAAATLLAEWDDHLFALGLAPLRRVVRRVAQRLGMSDDDAFLVDPPDLLAASAAGDLAEIVAIRRRRAEAAAALRPPPCIEDGRAVAAGALRRLQGHPIGAPFRGPLTVRSDLADLVARPPSPGAVVAIPALTAPAAVALHRVGVRAVCSEYGGPLSHAALIARELQLSGLVGCRGCTRIAEGTEVLVDTRSGRLRVAADARTRSDAIGPGRTRSD